MSGSIKAHGYKVNASDSTYRIKYYEISSRALIKKLKHITDIYRSKNKCLYVNWLASDLGLPKTVFTAFLLENSHIFSVELGPRSSRLILKDIEEEDIIFNDIYYSRVFKTFAIPVGYNKDNDEFVCRLEPSSDNVVTNYYDGLTRDILYTFVNVSNDKEKVDEFKRTCRCKEERDNIFRQQQKGEKND